MSQPLPIGDYLWVCLDDLDDDDDDDDFNESDDEIGSFINENDENNMRPSVDESENDIESPVNENDIDIEPSVDESDIKMSSSIHNYINHILNLPDDSEFGYILEVDLEYPTNIHEKHNDFPFCAERGKLPKQAFDILGDGAGKFDKLLLTLIDKEKYIIHFRMLALALKHGLILKKSTSYIEIQTESMVKAIHRFKYRTEEKGN